VGSDSQEAAAPPGWKRDGTGRRSSYLSFTSTSRSNLPPDITIQVDRPPNLLIPILLVFAVPAVLAYAVRRRAAEASADRKMNWIVWLNWSSLGIWLYWISVVNPVQLPDYLLLLAPVGSISRLLLGVLIYAGPPLFSVSGCFLAMAPLLSSSKESFWLLLRQQFVAQATFQVPLGIFLVGVDNDDWSGPTFSLFAAYVVYRGLVWLNWTMSYSEVTPLESGDLFERASALARKAGVKLSKLGMLRTRVPEQANAFAMSGDKIVLTESLVRGLTPREVNAVIAHELGHHKAGHLRFNPSQILFWVFIFGVGPGMGWLVSRYHFPTWWLNIPILPLGLVVVQGFFSQRRELEADARAAQITDDPEGKIAALGRLAQLSRIPVEGRGIMASIMSHPSMENRVLALARRYNVPDIRALAILRNPDEAYQDSIRNLAREIGHNTVPEPAEKDPVFNLRARVGFGEHGRWLTLLTPPAAAFLIGLVIDKLFLSAEDTSFPFYGRPLLLVMLLLSTPLILAASLSVGDLKTKLFFARMRRKIALRVNPLPHSGFAGIHPGRGVRYTEGFADWDLGFVRLEDDWLVYRGEKTRFAIARQDIRETRIVKDPLRWRRDHRVEIVFGRGAFTLTTNCARPTRASAERTLEWISAWIKDGAYRPCAGAASEPAPCLPRIPGSAHGRVTTGWYLAKTVVKMWLAAPLLFFIGFYPVMMAHLLVMFAAPLAVILRFLPFLLWPTRRVEDPAEEPQPVREATEVSVGTTC
jgi:Zn-dependent protease with chaperone function